MSSETPEFITSVPINKNGDDHICWHCEQTFRSNSGLNQHLRWCKQKMRSECEPANGRHEHIETTANTKVSTTTLSAPQKSCTWGDYPSHVFEANVWTVYKEIVYWKKNLFLLPSGRAGKQFIYETTKWMNKWFQ